MTNYIKTEALKFYRWNLTREARQWREMVDEDDLDNYNDRRTYVRHMQFLELTYGSDFGWFPQCELNRVEFTDADIPF